MQHRSRPVLPLVVLAIGAAPWLAAQDSLPDFELSLEPCPREIEVPPRTSRELVFDAVLSLTNNPDFPSDAEGAQGWTLSLAAAGVDLTGATTRGTVAARVDDDPPGLRRATSFEITELTNAGVDECAGREGVVSAVVLSLNEEGVTLRPQGSSVVLKLTALLQAPPPEGPARAASIFFADSCQGRGSPVANFISWRGRSVPPSRGRCDFDIVAASDRPFRRGDTTGDGTIELTDGVNILRCKFLGQNCPSCRDAADANDDGDLEITDAIRVFGYLFHGGAPPESPGPHECGPDPSEDSLPTCEYECDGATS